MEIKRDFYLNQLIGLMGGDMVKVVTGIRRCGKSYLLFTLFKRYLLAHGVKESHIVEIALDDEKAKALRNPIALAENIRSRIAHMKGVKYLFIDEIQLCRKVLPPDVNLKLVAPVDSNGCYVTFYDVLNEFRKREDVDVYVTGSNSKMLSSDIATEFRGRSEEIRMHPLSFGEYLQLGGADKQEALDEYLVWGGMPAVALAHGQARKGALLKSLFERIYLKDICERRKLKNDTVISAVTDVVASAVGSLTNPNKLVNALRSQAHVDTTNRTLAKYLGYLEDAFLFTKAQRWDVRGRKFLDFPCKYYAEDLGLRNARLNFREPEMPHLMENAIWNELVRRGYSVDVGVVPVVGRKDGRQFMRTCEIDFIVNSGSARVYIQSAFSMDNPAQRDRETLSLRKTGDFFAKMFVRSGYMKPTFDDNGIMHVGLISFLLDSKILEEALHCR